MTPDDSTEKYLRDQRDAARASRNYWCAQHADVYRNYAEVCVKLAVRLTELRTTRIVATVAVITALVLAGCVLHLRHELTLHASTTREVPAR
jgi:hypothetical protein